MPPTPSIATDLPLAPLGAGVLIDRSVRLYRRHLLTLIRISAPPIIFSTIGWIMLGVVFVTPSGAMLLFYILLGVFGEVVIVAGYIFSLIHMAGNVEGQIDREETMGVA